ncbi:MAG: class I SAM-dependent methyltransferase [Planctomycetota bacterium]
MFSDSSNSASTTSTTIPPEIYDIAFGWDPAPEVERLLYLCRDAGLEPRSALELGCGTGRLLRALQGRLPELYGLDLSSQMVNYACEHLNTENCISQLPHVFIADMSDFTLDRTFDLIHVSANTLRWVCRPQSITSLWRCVAQHLRPGGLFIADLEFGVAEEASKVGQSATWTLSRGETLVRAAWTVVEPPSRATRCCKVEWVFEVTRGEPAGCWSEEFALRTYDADEFLRLATAEGQLEPRGFYLLRDPYLFETPTNRAVGRMLVALRRA